jgi:hypothetical protein
VLRRDKYCALVILALKYSLATYFDSGSLEKKKNYIRIRGVLDDALEGYAKKECTFTNKGENVKDDKHKFKHVGEFPCVK